MWGSGPEGRITKRAGRALANTLLIYTHPECEYSEALKEELDTTGAEYQEIDLALHPEAWARLEELTGGERTTPVSVEGDLVTVGFHGVG